MIPVLKDFRIDEVQSTHKHAMTHKTQNHELLHSEGVMKARRTREKENQIKRKKKCERLSMGVHMGERE